MFAIALTKPAETAAAIIKALEALNPYLSDEKDLRIDVVIWGERGFKVLEAQCKLRAEANYLHEINSDSLFNAPL